MGNSAMPGQTTGHHNRFLASRWLNENHLTMSLPIEIAASRAAEKRQVEADWNQFEKQLSSVLGTLQEDQYLILALKRSPGFVQFAAQGSYGLRAETVSNNYLPNDKRLTDAQIDKLLALGWTSPACSLAGGADQRKPEFSPNFYRDYPRAVSYDDVARLSRQTLIDVLGARHPGFLCYKAFDRIGNKIILPTLGLAIEPDAPKAPKEQVSEESQVRGAVISAMRKITESDDIQFDESGDISVRFGSALVHVRILEKPFLVRVFSRVLSNVHEDELLLQRVNDLNAKLRFVRLLIVDSAVIAAIDIFASPIRSEHVVLACEVLGSVADQVDDELQKEFGGRTAFGEFRPPPPKRRRIGFQ